MRRLCATGADWFASIGTDKSKGTKVFALVGDVVNTGLIEVPMGIKLRDLVYRLGGGIPENRKFKAVQTGGPSGGCIPEQFLDMGVDYESLTSAGSIMGSGGMIVMDETACMVDVAKFFMDFTRDESCGKCIPCRVGTTHLHGLLERISEGNGRMEDLETLERLGGMVKRTALCGLGQTAPNPVSSTLRYFRDEYVEHITNKTLCAGQVPVFQNAGRFGGEVRRADRCQRSVITRLKRSPSMARKCAPLNIRRSSKWRAKTTSIFRPSATSTVSMELARAGFAWWR